MLDNKTIKKLLLAMLSFYSVLPESRSVAPTTSSEITNPNLPITKYQELLTRFPKEFGIEKSDEVIKTCLTKQLEIFSQKAIQNFLAENPDQIAKLGNDAVATQKLKDMLTKACPAFAEIIREMHFYAGNVNQRGALFKFGSWAKVMLEIYKNGKLDLNGNLASIDANNLLLNCQMPSPIAGQTKLRLVNPFGKVNPIGPMPSKEDRLMVIAIPDGSEGEEGQKQAEVEQKLKDINKAFFFDKLLPREIFEKMEGSDRNLVEIMLNQMNLADILSIVYRCNISLDLDASFFEFIRSRPEGWLCRSLAYGEIIEEYPLFCRQFHLPPFPTEEFITEYKKILDNVYQDASKNEFSLNTPALEGNIMYNGKPYFKMAAKFFGYEDKTTEPNENEKELLELMREHGYPSIEYARARRERFSRPLTPIFSNPTQTPTQTPQQSSGESEPENEPGSRDGRNSEQMRRNQDNRPTGDTTSRENPQTTDSQPPTVAATEFTFSRFRKEPLSFISDLISSAWKYISSLWRKDKQKAS
jgi:hypothetical protein